MAYIQKQIQSFGNQRLRRIERGTTILISNCVSFQTVRAPWASQNRVNNRPSYIVAYAKAAMSEPKVRAVYEKMAGKKGKRPFDMAVSGYFKGK